MVIWVEEPLCTAQSRLWHISYGAYGLRTTNTENLTVDHSVRVTCLESVVRGRRLTPTKYRSESQKSWETVTVVRSPYAP
jgi:hypothetical protein